MYSILGLQGHPTEGGSILAAVSGPVVLGRFTMVFLY